MCFKFFSNRLLLVLSEILSCTLVYKIEGVKLNKKFEWLKTNKEEEFKKKIFHHNNTGVLVVATFLSFQQLLYGLFIRDSSSFLGKLRKIIATHNFPYMKTLTCSIGAASNCNSALSPSDIIRLADEALYKAKELGRNKVLAAK